jgi:hypothetical protein
MLSIQQWPNTTISTVKGWFGAQEKQKPIESQSWFGRNLCATSKLFGSKEGLHTILKTVIATGQIAKPNVFVGGTIPTLLECHMAFKSIDIVEDLNYLLGCGASCALRAKDFLNIGAKAIHTVSDAASTIAFIDYLQWINATRIGNTLSTVTIYGVQPLAFAATTPLSKFILSTSAAGFGLSTLAAIQRIQAGDTSTCAYLGLIGTIAEVGVRILLLSATTFVTTASGVIVTGSLGLVAAGTAGYCLYIGYQEKCRQEDIAHTLKKATVYSV